MAKRQGTAITKTTDEEKEPTLPGWWTHAEFLEALGALFPPMRQKVPFGDKRLHRASQRRRKDRRQRDRQANRRRTRR